MGMRRMLLFVLAVMSIGAAGCGMDVQPPAADESEIRGQEVSLPVDGSWVPASTKMGRLPSGPGSIEIENVGTFTFDSEAVETLRPDIFREGHFSLFDVLVHVADAHGIAMEYHLDGAMDTHIIDSLDGKLNWWYQAYYSSGWFEPNAFRMDMYPYKDNTTIRVYRGSEDRIARMCEAFGDEVRRLQQTNGEVVIPNVSVQDPNGTRVFEDVVVTPHNVRSDVLQEDVITALDIILSLGEQGELSEVGLNWYPTIARADPVDHYFIERIDEAEAYGRCGYVYEVGSRQFAGFSGSHIHIPTDTRVIVSPEYAMWFWLCL